jgi:DNA primase
MAGAELSETQQAVRSAGFRARDAAASGPSYEARGGEASAPAGPTLAPITLADLGNDPVTQTEKLALMAVLQLPAAVGPQLGARALQARLTNPTLELVKTAIAANADAVGAADWFARIRNDLPEQFRPVVDQLALSPIPERTEEGAKVWARAIVSALIEKDMIALKLELQSRLQRTDPSDAEARATIGRAMADLELERRRLRGE